LQRKLSKAGKLRIDVGNFEPT